LLSEVERVAKSQDNSAAGIGWDWLLVDMQQHPFSAKRFSWDKSRRHSLLKFRPEKMIFTLFGVRFVCDYLTSAIKLSKIPIDPAMGADVAAAHLGVAENAAAREYMIIKSQSLTIKSQVQF
jgi:hypothetical protein